MMRMDPATENIKSATSDLNFEVLAVQKLWYTHLRGKNPKGEPSRSLEKESGPHMLINKRG